MAARPFPPFGRLNHPPPSPLARTSAPWQVVKGIKWGSPVWVHVDEFRPYEVKNLKATWAKPVRSCAPLL